MEDLKHDEMYCSSCGKPIKKAAELCPLCGDDTNRRGLVSSPDSSIRSRAVALALCFFLGLAGAHRFYIGKSTSAIFMLLTLGGFFIGAFIDLINILTGNFRDNDGKKLENW